MTGLRARQLAQRRTALRARSRALRARAALQSRSLEPVLTWADRVQTAWQWLRGWPREVVLPLAAASGLWMACKPSRFLSVPLRLLSVWRLWQRLTAGRRA
ncbi:hypothetical protein [Hydrogenophaga sp. T2]|uniref:hypothetical protein n=1 Tax=Hydrogenophaga sp. T2 TaxID=3132823 RepID=UPI003CE81917